MNHIESIEPLRLVQPPRRRAALAAWMANAARGCAAHVLPPLVILGVLLLVWQLLGSRPGHAKPRGAAIPAPDSPSPA